MENLTSNLEGLGIYKYIRSVIFKETCTHIMSQDKRQGYALTGNTNSVNVIGDDTGLFQDSIELGSGTMKYYWVQSNTVKERKTKSKLVEIIKDSTTNFDDSKACGV